MLTLIQFNPDEHKKPQTFHVTGGERQVLGRRQGPVALTDTRISRRHAEVSIQNDVWVIRDLGSSNGTWVNGERIEGLCELEEGDRLVLGRTTLIVGHAEVTGNDRPATSDAPGTSDAPPKPGDELAVATLDSPANDAADAAAADNALEDSFAAHDSALAPDASDVELDIDLELDEISFDLGEASSVGGSIDLDADEPDHAEPTGDRVDLEAEAMSNQASSLAPTAGDPPLVSDEAEVDEPAEIDEYAGADHFVAPRRPESPLDVSADADDGPAEAAEADPDVEALDDADDGGQEDQGDAPPVVGLSLEMPAPDEIDANPVPPAEVAEDPSEAAGDDEPELEHSLDLSDLPESSDLSESSDEVAVASASASASAPVSKPAEREPPAPARRDPERDIDLLDPEEAPDDLAYAARPRRGWGKLAVAAMLLVGTGIVAFWALRPADTATPIAGLADANPPAATSSEPTQPQASPGPRQAPALANRDTDPTPRHAPSVDVPGNPSPEARISDKPDPFGQTTTLSPTTPSPDASASTPVTAPRMTAPVDQANDADRPAASTPPTTTAAGVTAPTQPDTPTHTDPTADAGPTIAMATPPAPADPVAITPPTPADVAEPSPPVAAVEDARQIVFVIDASGSMVDSMNQGALSWLEQHLAQLSAADRFTVLFFRSDEVIEVPPLGLKANSELAQERTLAWVSPSTGNIRPRGKSEPIDALKKAKDYQATDIYILSDDKFGQRSAAASVDARDLDAFLGDLPVAVHTVQFFYKIQEDRRLEQIAQHFGGTYEFVEEPPFDLNDNAAEMDLIGLSR